MALNLSLILHLFLLLAALLISPFAYAQEYGVGLGVGFHTSNMIAYRLTFQKTAYYYPIRGVWQGALNWIQGRGNNNSQCVSNVQDRGAIVAANNLCQNGNNCGNSNNLYGGSIAHVVSFSKRCSDLYLVPYGEAGLGVALFNKNHVRDRRLGSNALFEITLGLGFRFGPLEQFDFGYKFIHFSNAYLARPNDGLNFNFITFSYWFD